MKSVVSMKISVIKLNLIASTLFFFVISSCFTVNHAQSVQLHGKMDEFGVAEVGWDVQSVDDIKAVNLSVFEIDGDIKVLRGQFRVPEGAVLWRSIPRRSLIPNVLDIRHYSQWGDPQVLTAGEDYEISVNIILEDVQTKSSYEISSKKTLVSDNVSNRPQRMEILGDFKFIALLVLGLLFTVIVLPSTFFVFVFLNVIPTVFNVLRQDIFVAEATRVYTSKENRINFYKLFTFLWISQKILGSSFFKSLASAFPKNEQEVFDRLSLSLKNLRAKDWKGDRFDLQRVAEGK